MLAAVLTKNARERVLLVERARKAKEGLAQAGP